MFEREEGVDLLVGIAQELQGAPETASTSCVGCGNCDSVCPVGMVDIIKRDY